jgi:hypothetical protein
MARARITSAQVARIVAAAALWPHRAPFGFWRQFADEEGLTEQQVHHVRRKLGLPFAPRARSSTAEQPRCGNGADVGSIPTGRATTSTAEA